MAISRAFSFVRGWLVQTWHCRRSQHDAITAQIMGRYTRLACSCGTTFWTRS